LIAADHEVSRWGGGASSTTPGSSSAAVVDDHELSRCGGGGASSTLLETSNAAAADDRALYHGGEAWARGTIAARASSVPAAAAVVPYSPVRLCRAGAACSREGRGDSVLSLGADYVSWAKVGKLGHLG
jgi:hypothetical protein